MTIRTCDHGIFYIMTAGSTPRCVQCQPPESKPAKIGFLRPDGSILSRLDMVRNRGLVVRRGRERLALRILGDAGWGDLEVIHPATGKDGWPKCSKRWLEFGKVRNFRNRHLPQEHESGNLDLDK